jgi:hypothetical protein
MSDDLVNRILGELPPESVDGKEFDHAVVEADLQQVTDSLMSSAQLAVNSVYCDITKRLEWVPERKFFVTQLPDRNVMIWKSPNDTAVLKQLSLDLGTAVKWIAAYEAMRCWAYLEYQDGELTECVLDPIEVWSTNVTSGEVLTGRGDREHGTLSHFLKAIAGRYKPLDTFWTFGFWNNREVRSEEMNSSDTEIHWALEIGYEKHSAYVSEHGSVPSVVREQLTRIKK